MSAEVLTLSLSEIEAIERIRQENESLKGKLHTLCQILKQAVDRIEDMDDYRNLVWYDDARHLLQDLQTQD